MTRIDALTLSLCRDLERRFDGPIPAHLLRTPAADLRRDIGTVMEWLRMYDGFARALAQPGLSAAARERLTENRLEAFVRMEKAANVVWERGR